MPIEIKELHIKVTVNTPQRANQSNGQSGAEAAAVSPDIKDAIVAECVEQVMQILKEKNER
jgi:hypothetical protein